MRYNHIQCLSPDVHLFTSLSIKSSKEHQCEKQKCTVRKDKSFQSPSSSYKPHWIDKETSTWVLLIPPKLLQFLVSFKRRYIFLFIKKKFLYRREWKNRAGEGLKSSNKRAGVYFISKWCLLSTLWFSFNSLRIWLWLISVIVYKSSCKLINLLPCFLPRFGRVLWNAELQSVISIVRAHKSPAKACSGTTRSFDTGLWPKELKLLN